MFKYAVTIFKVRGIDIRIDPSWLLIAGLIVWNLATQYFPFIWANHSIWAYSILGVAATLGFFGSLLLHELAHSIVALSFGLRITSITLFIFGGVAGLATEPKSARSEFLIAIAGPAMSFALAAAWYVLAIASATVGLSEGIVILFGYLGLANFILAVFNLLPAFPMDGGRVLRAALWYARNDLAWATLIASRLGNFLGIAMMAYGLLGAISSTGYGGFWLILIGFFVYSASRGVYQNQLISEAIEGRNVRRLMTVNPVTAEPWMTLEDLTRDIMLDRHVSFIPVVSRGNVLGYIDRQTLRQHPREAWARTSLDAAMERVTDANSVSPDETLQDLLDRMQNTGQRKFLVLEHGKLVGVISITDLLAFVSLKQELHL
ncbi:MAG TPA: site-2 protease family protein [Paracoccaceae bacterium]|nr:site-2 protease family protein [Paracoccaceae bacterium]